MNLFLIILLIVAGYFICFVLAASRLDSRTSLSTLALVVLLIYGCAAGIIILIGKYFGQSGLLLYAVCLVYSLAYWIWKGYQSTGKRHKIQWGPFLTLLAYILAILYLTLITRESGAEHRIQMHVFNWLNSSAQSNNISTFSHTFSNFVMFIPLGIVFPFITENTEKKFVAGASFGMLLSVLIETGQLLFHSGLGDIDDILANTLGAAAGALLSAVYLKVKRNKKLRQ